MIHDAIMNRIKDRLVQTLQTPVPEDDLYYVGAIVLGHLQGDPDPDEARISITIHENDPDKFISGSVTGMSGDWSDEVEEIEIGSGITWVRRFTIKARCLLERTQEDLETARDIASTIRTSIEHLLPTISFADINENGEYVSRGIISMTMGGEMLQAGGPPRDYDFIIKIRFDVLTTKVNQ